MTHNKKRKSVHGFTLLEMTIVVIIISILFLLSVPTIQKTLAIVNQKGCAAIEKVADAAILEYRLEYGEYPGSAQDLVNAGLLSENQLSCDGFRSLTIVNGQAVME